MALESGNKFRQDMAEHLVLNSHRLTTYDEIRKELHVVLGTKKFLGNDVTVQTVQAMDGQGSQRGKGRGGPRA